MVKLFNISGTISVSINRASDVKSPAGRDKDDPCNIGEIVPLDMADGLRRFY
jgi:hypothetical protein